MCAWRIVERQAGLSTSGAVSLLALLVRVGLGGLFLWTGLDKALDPAAFAVNIKDYGILQSPWVEYASLSIPWLEILGGLCLLLGLFLRVAGGLVSFLLLLFIAALVVNWGKVLPSGCGCFPWESEPVQVGPVQVLRDGALFVLALLVTLAGRSPFSLDAVLRRSGRDGDLAADRTTRTRNTGGQ